MHAVANAAIEGGAMKVPRSRSRRIPNVASAGWFSVLKNAPRTVALRPPGGYRVLVKPSSAPETSIETSEQLADRLRTTKIPLIGDSGMIDRGWVRMALIVLAAISFTYFILWWIKRGHL
jgi:hypothetical protein